MDLIVKIMWVLLVAMKISFWTTGLQLTEEYCTSERFNARCSSFEILLVRRALYGRLAAGRCITAEYAHAIGCFSDVTSYVDEVCSGRTNCSLLVASLDSIAQPCAKDFKSYLEVTHECVRASFADDCISQNETRLNGSSGFLALFERASNSTHYQIKTSCPWVIQVNKGQRINVTWQVSPSIHSFSVDDGSSDNMNEDDSMEFDDDAEFSFDQDQRLSTTDRISCPLQITFVEISSFPVTHIICRNETKEPRIVYLSKTNRLEIKVASLLVPHEVLTSEFDSSSKRKHGREHTSVKSKRTSLWKPHVLHYKVFGCPYFLLPTSASISKHGEDVAIMCNDSLEIFYVTCVGNQWIGEIGNCSKSAFKMKPPSMVSHSGGDYKRGVALAVLTGIGLGMVAGSFMLLTICLMRKRRTNASSRQKSLKKHSRSDLNSISMTQNSCLMHQHPCCANQGRTHFHRIKSDLSRSNGAGGSEEAYWATKVNHSECSLYSHCSVGTNDTITTPVNQWPAIVEDSKFCNALCRSTAIHSSEEEAGFSPVTKRSDQPLVRHCPHLLRHSSKPVLENADQETDCAARRFEEEKRDVSRSKKKHFDVVCTSPLAFDSECQSNQASCLLSCH